MTGYYDLEPWQRDGLDRAIQRDEAAKRLTGPPDPEPPHLVGFDQGQRPPQDAPPELLTLADLMAKAEAQADWMLDGLLPVGGLSLCVAAPKVGKSTFARALMLATVRGMEFLDRLPIKGAVLSVSLEDSPRKAVAHLVEMGARPDDPIYWAGHSHLSDDPAVNTGRLQHWIESTGAALTVIDPLFKFVRILDDSAYGEVTRALDPLMRVARDTGCHIMATHHARKSGGKDGSEVLGSQALFGGVDTLLTLERDGSSRTVRTIQREGDDLPDMVLRMDPTGWIEAAGSKADAKARELDEAVLACLDNTPRELREIRDTAELRESDTRGALNRLVRNGFAFRTGTARKGDPHRYHT